MKEKPIDWRGSSLRDINPDCPLGHKMPVLTEFLMESIRNFPCFSMRCCSNGQSGIKDDKIFTPNARREAGHQLGQVQAGLDPDQWKPFNDVGLAQKRSSLISMMDGSE